MNEIIPPEEAESIQNVSSKKESLKGKKALRDHTIFQNDFRVDIKEGDDLEKVPYRYYQTLKSEKVI